METNTLIPQGLILDQVAILISHATPQKESLANEGVSINIAEQLFNTDPVLLVIFILYIKSTTFKEKIKNCRPNIEPIKSYISEIKTQLSSHSEYQKNQLYLNLKKYSNVPTALALFEPVFKTYSIRIIIKLSVFVVYVLYGNTTDSYSRFIQSWSLTRGKSKRVADFNSIYYGIQTNSDVKKMLNINSLCYVMQTFGTEIIDNQMEQINLTFLEYVKQTYDISKVIQSTFSETYEGKKINDSLLNTCDMMIVLLLIVGYDLNGIYTFNEKLTEYKFYSHILDVIKSVFSHKISDNKPDRYEMKSIRTEMSKSFWHLYHSGYFDTNCLLSA